MATWTIVGEAGKTVDETAHSLEALQAEGIEPDFNSLASDKLKWSVFIDTMDDAATLVPDLAQEITLLRDGVRQFTGNVTGRRIRFDGQRHRAEITVEGPWWWLANIPLSEDTVDSGGTSKERAQFVFAQGTVQAHLAALIARAVALGAPIQAGTIDACFTIPRLTLRNMSLAEAFSELMRWIPDGRIYFDYSAAGLPKLSMARRSSATVITLDAASDVLPIIDLTPRLDLKLEKVDVVSAQRATVSNNRVTQWVEETAGSESGDVPSRQINVVSGPEIDTWLPPDSYDSVTVQSRSLTASVALIANANSVLRATGASFTGFAPYTEDLGGGATLSIKGVASSGRVTDRDGNALPSGFNYYLIAGEPREWWADAGIEWMEAQLAITAYKRVAFNQASGTPADPDWFDIFGGEKHTHLSGVNSRKFWWMTATASVIAVKSNWASPTVLIRPEDYDWVNPPAGLATNLLATQDWLPYEGVVTHARDEDPPAGNAVGNTLNIDGILPELEDMKALVSGYSYSIRTGLLTYRLGAPARHAYRDLVNRFRATGNDNIEFIGS